MADAAQARSDDVKVAAADAAQQQAALDLQNGRDQLAALKQQLARQQQDYEAAISTVAGLCRRSSGCPRPAARATNATQITAAASAAEAAP